MGIHQLRLEEAKLREKLNQNSTKLVILLREQREANYLTLVNQLTNQYFKCRIQYKSFLYKIYSITSVPPFHKVTLRFISIVIEDGYTITHRNTSLEFSIPENQTPLDLKPNFGVKIEKEQFEKEVLDHLKTLGVLT